MNGLRETCHCGHDKASHYLDRTVHPAKLCACLCGGCECTRYINENDPPPPKPRGQRPRHIATCQCSRCKEFDAPAPEIPTDPYPPPF